MKITKDYLKKLIKEEIAVMEGDDGSGSAPLTPEQEKVQTQIGDLIDAIEEMESSNPKMTDDYVYLFKALAKKGDNLNGVMTLMR